MKNMTADMLLEGAKLEQAVLLELFDVDITAIGGDLLRFHAGTNELNQSVVWKGNNYSPYPVQATGFELSGQGTSNRPKLVFANISGLITGLTSEFEELVGCTVTRRQMYITHLDAENFQLGNTNADPTQEIVSRFIVERLVSLTSEFVTLELSLPSETDGAIIPARIITTSTCSWLYRTSDCGYTGGAVSDEKDQPTSDPARDKCGKRLSSCKLRFGENGILPFGGFPSADKVSR